MIIYYAHCISIFNTPQEARDVKLLEDLGFEVYNPNNPHDSEMYNSHGMTHFYELVLSFPALAFRALPDGRIPAGIYREVMWAQEANVKIIELPSGLMRREMNVDLTCEYLKEVGKR